MDSTTEPTDSVQPSSINGEKKPKNGKQKLAAVPVTSKKYNLRIKSTKIGMNESQLYRNHTTNANHHHHHPHHNDSPSSRATKLLKHKPPPLSKYRRRTANLRERCRMQEINDAFKKLQSVVPDLFSIADTENNHPEHHHHINNNPNHSCSNQSIAKLTKINTLKLAVNYISALTQILKQSDDPNSNSNNTDMDESRPSPLDIDTNRCATEFHFATGLEPQSHPTSSISKNVEFASSSSSSLSSSSPTPPPPPPPSSSSSSSFLIQTAHINSYLSNPPQPPPPPVDFQSIVPNKPTPTMITARAEDYFQDIHLVHHHPHLLASPPSSTLSFSNHQNVEKFKITNLNDGDDDLANNIDTIFDDLDCLLFEDYGP